MKLRTYTAILASLALAALASETATPQLTKAERLAPGIRLTWTYPTPAMAGVEAWRIQRQSDAGEASYITLASFKPQQQFIASEPARTTLTWTDKGAAPGIGYTYTVLGFTETGGIPPSNALRIGL